ncbi:MAG: hypothetical protein V4805_08980 [Pseudomonadota bacterium]
MTTQAPIELNEIEDYSLAICENEWIDLDTTKRVLESWLERMVTSIEMKSIVEHLLLYELIDIRIMKLRPATIDENLSSFPLNLIEFIASKKGESLLKRARIIRQV